jgi:hypothetical protein
VVWCSAHRALGPAGQSPEEAARRCASWAAAHHLRRPARGSHAGNRSPRSAAGRRSRPAVRPDGKAAPPMSSSRAAPIDARQVHRRRGGDREDPRRPHVDPGGRPSRPGRARARAASQNQKRAVATRLAQVGERIRCCRATLLLIERRTCRASRRRTASYRRRAARRHRRRSGYSDELNHSIRPAVPAAISASSLCSALSDRAGPAQRDRQVLALARWRSGACSRSDPGCRSTALARSSPVGLRRGFEPTRWPRRHHAADARPAGKKTHGTHPGRHPVRQRALPKRAASGPPGPAPARSPPAAVGAGAAWARRPARSSPTRR